MEELAAAVGAFGRWLAEDDDRGPVTLNAECTRRGGTALDVSRVTTTLEVHHPDEDAPA